AQTHVRQHRLGGGCLRRFLQTSPIRSKDEGGRKPATWPTAESVILQRISSTSNKPLSAPSKEKQAEMKEKEAEGEIEGESESGGSVLSVSGIINSVREHRAASSGNQQQHQNGESGNKGQLITGLVDEEWKEPAYYLFNTYELVDRLEHCGFTRSQATTLMVLVRNRVHRNMERVSNSMLSRSDLENDAYLFRSALQELRTETQVIRKNDQAILESQAAAISRDIDSLAQKIADEISNLRSEIEIELNNRRHETNHEMKSLDMELHDLASKYQVVVGEMKTGIEAIKLESIRRGLVTAVLTTLLISVLIWAPELVRSFKKHGEKQGESKKDKKELQQGLPAEAVEMRTQGGPDKLYPAVRLPDGQVLVQKGDASTMTDDDGYRAAARRRFRDHSHLNIHYDPSASPYDLGQYGDAVRSSQDGLMRSNRAYGRGISSSDSQDHYDDWFDSFFYSPRHVDGPESASLMDSDSRMDSSLLDATTEQVSDKKNGGQDNSAADVSKSDNNQPMADDVVVHVPLHFTYQSSGKKDHGASDSGSKETSNR
ncbi:hypothetical protein LPJ57_004088, partial [Coemansia sp. RSA 486]